MSHSLICLIALLASGLLSLPSAADDHPNIVIILVDDMGYGDPGFNNPDSKIATPNLDGLAGEGMRFIDAHAPGPLCHMSRYGLLTGRYPFRTNVSRWPKQPLIDEGQMTIASLRPRATARPSANGTSASAKTATTSPSPAAPWTADSTASSASAPPPTSRLISTFGTTAP